MTNNSDENREGKKGALIQKIKQGVNREAPVCLERENDTLEGKRVITIMIITVVKEPKAG